MKEDTVSESPSVSIPPFAEGGVGSLLCAAAHAYREEYVLSLEDGPDHEPTEFEHILLEDFFSGLISDERFFGVVRQLLDQRLALFEALKDLNAVLGDTPMPDCATMNRLIAASSRARAALSKVSAQ